MIHVRCVSCDDLVSRNETVCLIFYRMAEPEISTRRTDMMCAKCAISMQNQLTQDNCRVNRIYVRG